jgi:hypothetical protein
MNPLRSARAMRWIGMLLGSAAALAALVALVVGNRAAFIHYGVLSLVVWLSMLVGLRLRPSPVGVRVAYWAFLAICAFAFSEGLYLLLTQHDPIGAIAVVGSCWAGYRFVTRANG